MRRKISDAERRRVVELYESGMGGPEIGRAVGLGETTAYRILERSGVHRHKRALGKGGMSKFDMETSREIAEKYAAGMTLAALSREHGGTTISLANAVRRAGGTMRPAGGRLKHLTLPERERILSLRVAGLSQEKIGRELGLSQTVIGRFLQSEGLRTRSEVERHGSWKGGRLITSSGYIYVLVRDGDRFERMRNRNGYAAEHRLVVAEILGRPLTARETVHHRNGKRDDNRPENLELRFGPHGRGAALRCADCGSRHIVAD